MSILENDDIRQNAYESGYDEAIKDVRNQFVRMIDGFLDAAMIAYDDMESDTNMEKL